MFLILKNRTFIKFYIELFKPKSFKYLTTIVRLFTQLQLFSTIVRK